MISLHTIVRNAEQNYLTGTVKLGKYVSWSMFDTIETIDAYLNSVHTSGKTDSLGREKPFFDIVTAATNVWYRATDIDRKDLRFIPSRPKSVVLSFIANILLQKWMDDTNFGQFLNQWGRALARYGSAVVKFVEKDGKLTPVVVPWNRFIADAVDFDSIPHIEKLYFTPAQLRRNKAYDQKAVDSLLESLTNRKTLNGQEQDNNPDFVEVYEVHGLMDSRLLKDNPEPVEDKDIVYTQQMHVISSVSDGDEYKDFTLYSGREAKDPYLLTHLIQEDGRTLSIGAVEHLFEAQWMTNHSVKAMKDTIDLTSMLIMQTADPRFLGRNILSALETGDILVHQPNMPLEPVNNSKPDLTYVQNFSVMWRQLGQEVTGTPDLTRGISQVQPLTYGLGQILNNNSNSLFEIMTENKGLDLERMCREYVIPDLKKKIKAMKSEDMVAMLDESSIAEIDAYFLPQMAIREYNDQAFQQVSDAFSQPINTQLNPQDLPGQFDMQTAQQDLQQKLAPLGNKRIFKTDELSETTWSELLADYEWDCLKLVVTNENTDQQAILQTLSTALQTIATNPMVLQDPNGKMLFNKLLSQTGVVSPIELSSARSPMPSPISAPMTPPTMPAPVSGG